MSVSNPFMISRLMNFELWTKEEASCACRKSLRLRTHVARVLYSQSTNAIDMTQTFSDCKTYVQLSGISPRILKSVLNLAVCSRVKRDSNRQVS